jgi:hypothetical protein
VSDEIRDVELAARGDRTAVARQDVVGAAVVNVDDAVERTDRGAGLDRGQPAVVVILEGRSRAAREIQARMLGGAVEIVDREFVMAAGREDDGSRLGDRGGAAGLRVGDGLGRRESAGDVDQDKVAVGVVGGSEIAALLDMTSAPDVPPVRIAPSVNSTVPAL